MHGARHLSSSIHALRKNSSVTDIRLERKLRYDYAKLKARGQLRMRKRYASATHVATDPSQTDLQDPSSHTTTGAKRTRSHYDPGRDAQKHQRRTGSLAEGGYRTPMSSRTPDTRAYSPDISIDHDDDVSGVTFPRGTEDSLAHRAAPVAVGVSAEAHAEVVHELKCLRETVVQNQSKLEEQNARLSRDLDIDTRRLR